MLPDLSVFWGNCGLLISVKADGELSAFLYFEFYGYSLSETRPYFTKVKRIIGKDGNEFPVKTPREFSFNGRWSFDGDSSPDVPGMRLYERLRSNPLK